MKIVALHAFLASQISILMYSQSVRPGFRVENIYWHMIIPLIAVVIAVALYRFLYINAVKSKPISSAYKITTFTILGTVLVSGAYYSLTTSSIFIGVFAIFLGIVFSIIPALIFGYIMGNQFKVGKF